jgi:uncharacterized protein (DUF1778 family)
MAKRKAPAVPRNASVTLKLSPQEYQLLSYAASRSRARGVQMWMRERLLEAAKAKVTDKTATRILEGRATAALLKESLAEARASKRGGSAKVLAFRGSKRQGAGE